MLNILKRLFRKPTLIFYLSIISLPVFLGICFFTNWVQGGLWSIFLLVYVLALSIISFIIDRCIALLTKISPIKLSIYELIILVIAVVYFSFSSRKTIVEWENPNTDYFLVIENPGNLESAKTTYSFPFNKKVSTNKSYIILEDASRLDFSPGWESHYKITSRRFRKYPNVKLYSKLDTDLNDRIDQDFVDGVLGD